MTLSLSMKKIAFIPARYAATRFPGKLMQMLGDKPVIRHTYENTLATGLFDDVFVVTDHKAIFDEIVSNNGRAIMSSDKHLSGSDRIAEVVTSMDVDVIVNVQGDEPFVKKEILSKLLALFKEHDVHVGSLMKRIDQRQARDPNAVKVVVDKNYDALYFSRSMIPFDRDSLPDIDYFLHLGIYGYRKQALLKFTQWPPTKLEVAEKLEQLRYLENGIRIRMAEVDQVSIAIDTPADLETARKILETKASTTR